jgi:hypothetical protein
MSVSCAMLSDPSAMLRAPGYLPLVWVNIYCGFRDDMSKSTRNGGKGWSGTDRAHLRQLARENTPTRVIGFKLGRTEDAVRNKAGELGVSLKPTNQSPYNRRK